MERSSFSYRARRKCQALAARILPDATLCRLYSKVVLKKKVDLKNPGTFNEKIQWMKIYAYPHMPLVAQCADKYAVRQYLEEKGMSHLSVPLLGVWDRGEDIPWDSLPDRFVLKCNHGCAYNILVNDKEKLDKKAAVRQLNRWLKEDFGAFNVERHYSAIRHHRIVCEEFLGECITDYKFFCFHGEPKCIYVSSDLIHDRQAQIGFFNLDGSKIPLIRSDYADVPSITLPPFFEEMRKDAVTLGADFPFVRVDFFVVGDRYYFAELTFTPSAGMMPFVPEHFDRDWGQWLDIEELRKQYE